MRSPFTPIRTAGTDSKFAASKDSQDTPLPAGRSAGTYAIAAIAALSVSFFAFVLLKNIVSGSAVDSGLERLYSSFREERPLESRISDFHYAEFRQTRGDNSGTGTSGPPDETGNTILVAAASEPDNPRALHALGKLFLVKRKFDDAIKYLEQAEKLEPDNPQIKSDLGTAFLERAGEAEIARNGEEFFVNMNSALRHIDSALEMNGRQPEALFNRALALEKMTLTAAAAKAWNKYVEIDAGSPWAREAKENLARAQENNYNAKTNAEVLEDFLVAFRSANKARAWEVVSQTKELVTGVMVQHQLAMELLTAKEQKNADRSSEMISALKFLGELEREYAKDEFFIQLAGYYGNANDATLATNLEAQRAMHEGHKLMLMEDFVNALSTFENAKALFEKAGNTWEAHIAEFQACYTITQADDLSKSKARLLALSELCAHRKYLWLQTLSEGWIGSNLGLLGEFSGALDADRNALDLATGTSDVYNVQRSLVQIANQFGGMGNQEQALDNVYKSLIFPASYYTFPRQRMRNLYFTTNLLYRFKHYETAAEYARAMVDLTENQLQDRWMSQVGRNQLAASYGGLKRYPEALETAGQSMRIAETITDEGLRKRLTITSLLTMARVQRQSGDCRAAIGNYEKGVKALEGMESVMDKYETLSGRFQCHVAEKDDQAIKTSMPEVLGFLDANRQKIKQEADRYIFFDSEQVVYDAAVGYIFSQRRDAQTAFDYAETSRARSLLSLVGRDGDPPAPLSVSEIQSQMPADVQMVYYAVLKDKLLIWYLSSSKFEAVEVPVGTDEIENKVAGYLETLRSADYTAAKQSGKELYPLLIKPVENLLEKDKTICFVADKSLFRIPFAAIISPDNRYLIEDNPVIQAPSASIFIRLTGDAARKNSAGEESVLSIGNPSFSRQDYPGLKDLPDAIREAETVADYYTSAKLLTDKTAVKKAVLAELPKADIFHFAGHYVPNLRWPKLSKLVLTDDLTVQEIMDNSLSRPRLIVLSGCETGVEKFYNGEGMIGAARAFLASNVPVVVATQWPVDSASAARLMVKFHQYRKEKGLNTSAALREAQLEMLREEGSRFSRPNYWAGFTTIGGYSRY